MIRTVIGATNGKLEYQPTTPKRLAQEIIVATIRGRLECMHIDEEYPELTPREKRLVWEQLDKLEKRVCKMLGFAI